MFDAIKSVSGCCAEKLRTCMFMSDSLIKLLRCVSDNVWGSADRQFVSRHIVAYLVQAWDVRITCKHSGAVLPFPSAPVGRGVDGIDAMARTKLPNLKIKFPRPNSCHQDSVNW
jgi:hypothetical protein